MKGDYPRFTENCNREELIEHFLLSETEKKFVIQFRGDVNRHGVAILLKSLQYLGYFPSSLNQVPTQVKSFIAKQLNLVGDPSSRYLWETTTRDNHFVRIRQYTGFRFPEASDKENLENWLRKKGAFGAYTFSDLFLCAIERLRFLGIELPSEKELQRVVDATLNGFFLDVHHRLTNRLSEETREKIDFSLIVPSGESFSLFQKLKASSGPSGMESLKKEIIKLQTLRSVGITPESLGDIPFKVIQLLKRRAINETASEMRVHPDEIRYGLMSCFISIRTMEVIDNIVEMFIAMIHRIDVRAAMIEGLIRHDTEMRVEKNFVDSHGQSEVAFAFCRLLNEFKLMPRLKRIKKERLYLPDKGMAKQFQNLAGVLTRPIRWKLVEQQYDEMMKATVAMKYGDATAFAILRRFSSINATHPTYKALIEKASFLEEA